MRLHRIALLAAAVAAPLLCEVPAAAQSDILLRLRSGSPLGDRFRVDSAGGVVAMGELGIGIIPYTGGSSGTVLMMFYPFKGAFRAGGPGSAGAWNDANVGFYTYGGGYNTIATGVYAFAHGDGAQATNTSAAAFGDGTLASGTRSFAAGYQSSAASVTSVAMGYATHAGASVRGATNSFGGATALGRNTTADADWSFAAGYRASVAGHEGAFVWGGSLAGASAATDSIRALADGEFAARAPGGFRFRTNTTTSTGCNLPAGSGVFSCSSSRLLKHGFADVDGEQVLSGIRAVPVTTWSYDAEGSQVRHMGPFAEDFRAAFGLGVDDTSIGLLDIAGVNFAGVQALEARTSAQAEEIRRLRDENAALRAQNARTEERLQRLEALLAPDAAP